MQSSRWAIGCSSPEFDVNDKDLPTNIERRDAQAAAVTRDYLDVMLSYRGLDQVWGLIDKYSWLRGYSPRASRTSPAFHSL